MGRLYQTKNQTGNAEKAFKSAMISNPDYLPPYYSLAKIYFSENREDAAIAQYKAAIKSRGEMNREQPNMMLGLLFSIKKQWELAQLHYRKALEINPDFAPAANNLAYLLAERGEHLDEALRLALKARKLLPEDPRVADTLGWVYVKLGFYEQAVGSFAESLQGLPDNAAIHFHLGMAYYKKGDMEQAKVALQKALDLDKNFAGAAEAAQMLADI
jgi:tetratricopeptide (TPR) repeat protein